MALNGRATDELVHVSLTRSVKAAVPLRLVPAAARQRRWLGDGLDGSRELDADRADQIGRQPDLRSALRARGSVISQSAASTAVMRGAASRLHPEPSIGRCV